MALQLVEYAKREAHIHILKELRKCNEFFIDSCKHKMTWGQLGLQFDSNNI